MRSGFLTLIALPAAMLAQSQASISVPLVGIFASGTEVRPITGVPGAGRVAKPIALPAGLGRVYPAPLGQWGLVEDRPSGCMAGIGFNGIEVGAVTPIAGAMPTPYLVRFSPNGRSAILYSAISGSVQVLNQLNARPQVVLQLDASGLDVADAAISDDGTLPVVLTRTGAVELLQTGAIPLYSTNSAAGIAFLPNQTALAVADGGAATITILDNLAGRPSTRVVLPGPNLPAGVILLQASSDGNSLILAASGARTAYRADVPSQSLSSVDLPVSASRLDRLDGNLFLLAANPGVPAWLLLDDGSLKVGFAQSSGERTTLPGVGR